MKSDKKMKVKMDTGYIYCPYVPKIRRTIIIGEREREPVDSIKEKYKAYDRAMKGI